MHYGGDFMAPALWRKAGPVFSKNEHAWGVGHCGFAEAADRSDWLMYHAKTSRRAGWKDREVRAQPFSWTADGLPFFGQPSPLPLKQRSSGATTRRAPRTVRRPAAARIAA